MLRMFKKYNWRDWLLILILSGFIICHVYFDVTLPTYSRDIVNEIAVGTTNSILRIGGKMLLYVLGTMIASIIIGYIASFLSAKLGRKLRNNIFQKVQSFSMAETNKFSTASLITRSSNDIQQVQQTIGMILRLALMAPVTAIWAIAKINDTSTALTLATVAWIGGLVLILGIIFLVVFPKFHLMQKLTDRLNGVTRENMTGLRVVKAYAAQDYQNDKFAKVNKQISSANIFVNRLMGIFFPLMMLVMNGLILTIYWIGADMANSGAINIATITEFVGLSTQILMSFMILLMLFVMIPRAAVCAKRINQVLDTKTSIADPETTVAFTGNGEVEFNNVSFRYPGGEANVIEDISFKVSQGETLALIGSTGSGKSTLINLIMRFFDVTDGTIKVDGADVRQVKIKDLREKIGFVPQKGVLFSGTVRSNISYGKPEITDEKVRQASYIAKADEFIEKMADGYDSVISQGGKNVSGGQKQRLSIARAIARDPEIYIFDDSFSALDYQTDREVRARLKEYTKHATSIIVAQRIGTIMEADKIIVLDHGKMVGIGNHRQLLKDCPIYLDMALSQLSREELGI